MVTAIETKNLSYAYHKGIPILKNISISVPPSSIYGFLGPNGAGKTTAMRLLCGLLPFEENKIFYKGKPLEKQIPYLFNNLSSLIETPSLYYHLSAFDNLKVITTLRNLPKSRIYEVLETVGLNNTGNKKVKQFSLGMKQRLALAMALLPKPDILMLDEPVNGLDPQGIIEMRELLIQLNKEFGTTILISSHLLAEIEKMCSHAAIIHKGIIRFEGSLDELKRVASTKKAKIKIQDIENHHSQLKPFLNDKIIVERGIVIMVYEDLKEVALFNASITQEGIPVVGIQTEGGLEEWFINIINQH